MQIVSLVLEASCGKWTRLLFYFAEDTNTDCFLNVLIFAEGSLAGSCEMKYKGKVVMLVEGM